ncbi:MAG: DUF167 family protein [Burkholderiales bacterium]|nr:DUF167 family protein [Burkholderiales bacterium]
MSWFRQEGESLTLTLHIQPGAKKTEIAGLHGDALKIRLAAPPVEGQANSRLIAYLAEKFGVPQRNVILKHGETSRRKVLVITGSSVAPGSLLA